jgi:hypothetical protein
VKPSGEHGQFDRPEPEAATYIPVNIAAIREADQARRTGRGKPGLAPDEFQKLKLVKG